MDIKQKGVKSMTEAVKTKKPFFKNNIVIILLFAFFPPIGIPLFLMNCKRPSKKVQIIISAIWGIVWIAAAISSLVGSYRTYLIDDKKVTITCGSSCSYIEDYGDKDALKILASLGIQEISYASAYLTNNKAEISLKNLTQPTDKIIIEISNSSVTKVYNKDYPTIIYYSVNQNDEITNFPSEDKINALKKAKEDEQRAIAEKYSTETDTANLCEKTFHDRYPYNGSKVHSILGAPTNATYETDSRLYKVKVTIQNGFGASYDAVMECVVKKVDSSTIQITSFNIY